MHTLAYITPAVIAWGRKRIGFTVDDLALRMKPISAERLNAWERGDEDDRPTLKQARALADSLRMPLGYLFLDRPPEESLPLPDLRSRAKGGVPRPSPDLIDVIYDALRKQEWYQAYLTSQDAGTFDFVGKFPLSTPPSDVAREIRSKIGISSDLRRQASDTDDYFRLLVRACESTGISVLRNSVVGNNTHRPLDSEEFQGFAIADSIAPVVFVNQSDFMSAQVFTLAHELAHLWYGTSGVSDPEYLEIEPNDGHASHQVLADQVAAEILIPEEEFKAAWLAVSDADLGAKLDELRRRFKVSSFVVLRRAFDFRRISKTEYRAEFLRLRANVRPKSSGGGGGGYRSIFARNGPNITRAVLNSVSSGTIAPTEAALLLNVSTPSLFRMEKYFESEVA